MIYKYLAEDRREAEKPKVWFVSFQPKDKPTRRIRSSFVAFRVEPGPLRVEDGQRGRDVVFAVVSESEYEAAIGRLKDMFGAGEVLAASPKPVGFTPKAWRQ